MVLLLYPFPFLSLDGKSALSGQPLYYSIQNTNIYLSLLLIVILEKARGPLIGSFPAISFDKEKVGGIKGLKNKK